MRIEQFLAGQIRFSSDRRKADANASAGKPINRSELRRFIAQFGTERGAKYLADGLTFEEALLAELKEARAKLATRDRQKEFNRKAGFGLPIRLH